MEPENAETQFPLSLRFAWATGARLVLLSLLLVAIVFVNLRGQVAPESYTLRVGLGMLLASFALSGSYAWFLRQGKYLRRLVAVQLVFDQLSWTVAVYLSGGATSGATSFYGISCLLGAILAGMRGALLAWFSAVVFYLSLVLGLAMGWFSGPPDQASLVYSPNLRELSATCAVTITVLATVALLGGTLTERLRITGGRLALAEQRVARAEREALLGRLAAGLAHEIRNPLGSIAASSRLLLSGPHLTVDERTLCDIIDREAQRLNDLVSDMLDLSRPRPLECVKLDWGAVVQEVTVLASRSGRGFSDVRVECEVLDQIQVEADSSMLRQLLWNLVRNAVQASVPGGVVRIVLRKAEAGAAVLDVVDHGAGIQASARAQLFDPFFTTRSQGTGIGLAVVKRIVDEHGWRVGVADTEGGGATFSVHVPRVG